MNKMIFLISLLLTAALNAGPKVELGVDLFFKEGHAALLTGKRVGLITNQTGVDRDLCTTADLFMAHAGAYQMVALFAPEHGIRGLAYAWESVEDTTMAQGIPIYSLHGKTRRPTEEMLKGIDVLVYDIQDIGVRAYTYATTLFYVMEEAAKRKISVIVLDRPNPISGALVDGPMLSERWRSYIGYINVPYCHGMTIGELARFFNEQYRIGCALKVIPMRGWERSMSYRDTGLVWIPTSPQIPEPDTPLFSATTGILGELSLVNIGVGYTLPFKIIGAPWIQADRLAEELNGQKISGVKFYPFYYRPFFGLYQGIDCQGVMIVITDTSAYRPCLVQCMLLGMLKTLYPEEVEKRLASLDKVKKELFCKASGNEEMLEIIRQEKYIAWKLIQFGRNQRDLFLLTRKKYLLY